MADDVPGRLGDTQVHHRLGELDVLLGELEETPGAVAETALDAVHLVAEIYGEALARVMMRAGSSPGMLESMLDDELLRHLFTLHDLHPDPVEKRVTDALAAVRPYAHSHGGDIEFVGIDDGVALVRLAGSCDGCSSSAATLELAVKEAVLAAAPELSSVQALASPGAHAQTLIPAEALLHRPESAGDRAREAASA
jgi:Fe-S cluster biogenesis protein NfuA